MPIPPITGRRLCKFSGVAVVAGSGVAVVGDSGGWPARACVYIAKVAGVPY